MGHIMKIQLPKLPCMLLLATTAAAGAAAPLDTAKIDELTDLKGTLNQQEGLYKVSLPRADLKITVDNWQMPAFMGLTSWAAFKPGMKDNAMVMGDLVLMQDEINPVMSAALNNGLELQRSTITSSTKSQEFISCTSAARATPPRSPEASALRSIP
jgi:hypothetical protein